MNKVLYRVDWDLTSYYYSAQEVLEYACHSFEPELPHHVMQGEDHTIPRVCLSDSVLGCLNSIGMGRLLEDIEYYEKFHKSPYSPICVYKCIVDTEDKGIIVPEDLVHRGLVPDALKNREYWGLHCVRTSEAKVYFIGYESFTYEMPLDFCELNRVPPVATSVKLFNTTSRKVKGFKWKIT